MRVLNYLRDVNLNLNVFWTLVVVLVGAPLLTFALFAGAVAVSVLLGYDPGHGF